MPPVSPFPPANWAELLGVVTAARARIVAPVDTIGCAMLADTTGSREDSRYQTLLSLMLSSQTRDEMTARAVTALKEHAASMRTTLSAAHVAQTPRPTLNKLISCVGFYNRKTDYIADATRIILNDHKGVVPHTVQALCALPGVGPKMAHLFVQAADGRVEGIGVDVHVLRIAHRWRWAPPTSEGNPEATREFLQSWLPKADWQRINPLLVGWGQTVCQPRNPLCAVCPAQALCPAAFTEESAAQRRERDTAAAASSRKAKGKAERIPDIETLVAFLASEKARRSGTDAEAVLVETPRARAEEKRPAKRGRKE